MRQRSSAFRSGTVSLAVYNLQYIFIYAPSVEQPVDRSREAELIRCRNLFVPRCLGFKDDPEYISMDGRVELILRKQEPNH